MKNGCRFFCASFFVIFNLSVFSSMAKAATCPSSLPSSYRQNSSQDFFFEVRLPKSILSERPHQKFRSLQSFQQSVKHKTSVDPYYLLKKQLEFFRSWPKEKDRFEKVIDRHVGRISDIGCLEALLMDHHLSKFKRASEFVAYVMTKSKSNQILVLINSQNKMDMVSLSPEVEHLKNEYRRQGWRLEIHLHNHPFSFSNPYGDISGTVMPSGPDISSYINLHKNEGLRRAMITNGFSTLELKSSEFRAL